MIQSKIRFPSSPCLVERCTPYQYFVRIRKDGVASFGTTRRPVAAFLSALYLVVPNVVGTAPSGTVDIGKISDVIGDNSRNVLDLPYQVL